MERARRGRGEGEERARRGRGDGEEMARRWRMGEEDRENSLTLHNSICLRGKSPGCWALL